MPDTEKPLASEDEVLKGENTVTIQSGDGRVGSCDIVVNGTKQTFETGKEITVSDAQLDVLRNSGHTVEEAETKKSKGKGSSDGEAGAGEGSLASAAKSTKGKAKTGAKAEKPAAEPASNVNNGGNTTTSETVKSAEEGKTS